MKTEREVVSEFRKIRQDYTYNPDIMNEEDERLTRLKKIIDQKLSLADKTIILLYVDCQSYRKLGKRLGVSHMTLRREVMRIKKIIMEEYDKMITEWRPVKGYEGLYIVSNMGEVKSLPRKVAMNDKGKEIKAFRPGVLLKQCVSNSGYKQVRLYRDGVGKPILVHRLVAMAFIPNPWDLPQVNHKDENRLNNRVENLEWCSAKYNGSYGERPSKYMRKVSQYTLSGVKVATYDSLADAARAVGCHYTHISHCCTGGKDKTAKGFIWRYENIH